MSGVDIRIVSVLLRLFPRDFRERFRGEMLGTYLDQRDAISASGSRVAIWRHGALTAAGLGRALGAVWLEQYRRTQCAQAQFPAPRSARMHNLLRDTRHAVRVLRTSPGFAAVAILTLALGIGANTAVFSVVNSVILAPLPYEKPEQLVRIYTAYPTDGRQFLTGFDILDVRDEVEALSSVGIFYSYREIGGDLALGGGSPQRIRVLPRAPTTSARWALHRCWDGPSPGRRRAPMPTASS